MMMDEGERIRRQDYEIGEDIRACLGRKCVVCQSDLNVVRQQHYSDRIGGPPVGSYITHLVCPKCKLRYDI